MDKHGQFKADCAAEVTAQGGDKALAAAGREWMNLANARKYSYHFEWLGRPLIQYPQDIVAMQELVWQVRPDLIIETGIAHGGSLIFSASMLAMLDFCEAAEAGNTIDPRKPQRRVLGVDIDIRSHNRAAIEAHPMAYRIDMIQGSSIAPETIEQVHAAAKGRAKVLVCLDSNHTHDHVLAELEAYAPLVSAGSYCCVFDTVIEDLPDGMFPDRPWKKGNNPKTAVWEYLRRLEKDERYGTDGGRLAFEIDRAVEHKLLVTVAPDGYLRRV